MNDEEVVVVNKLGVSNKEMEEIENRLFEVKSQLVSPNFTFDENEFGIIYLIRLHDFLFGDLYYDEDKMSERYHDSDKKIFEIKIKRIVYLIKNQYKHINYIYELIQELIDDKIFNIGNKRTINLFFNNVIDYYLKDDSEYKSELKNMLFESMERTF